MERFIQSGGLPLDDSNKNLRELIGDIDTNEAEELIDGLSGYKFSDDMSIQDCIFNLRASEIARSISYDVFSEGFEIEVEMRSVTFTLCELLLKQKLDR